MPRPAAVRRLVLLKYGVAGMLAMGAAGSVWLAAQMLGWSPLLGAPLALLLGILCFYTWEARYLFAFPLLARGAERPVKRSRCLAASAALPASPLRISTELAFFMLARPWPYQRLREGWVVGCLALLLLCERMLETESLPSGEASEAEAGPGSRRPPLSPREPPR